MKKLFEYPNSFFVEEFSINSENGIPTTYFRKQHLITLKPIHQSFILCLIKKINGWA